MTTIKDLQDELKLATPTSVDDQIAAYEAAGLHEQAEELKRDIFVRQRIDKINAEGLEEISLTDILKKLTSCKCYTEDIWTEATVFENKNFYRVYKYQYKTGWFSKSAIWSAPPNALKKPIPYGVALLIKECKDKNLFDYFMAFAPREAFNSKAVIMDPVIVGAIQTQKLRIGNSGEVWRQNERYFFLASWD